ncbi:flagellar protein FlaG [Neobacillus vireti]|uniref:Flagellar protein FlaG n=1 Tax=Neobacillus vireti LMG 21834 TaxID=1131730 RepID=A0AB94IQK1_9BACI|nr:flagellar protein FlaG [Neobacillus vireti]ETI69361.1 flagellar protein FlaG [Neobacillus vireti LMG 21834]KLT19815.1 flagellar protein FlaG [Neobacillus vireti]
MLEKLSNSGSQSTDYQVKQIESIPKIKETPAEKQEKPQQQVLTKEKTEKVINSMNDFLKASNSHLKFQFHEGLKEYYVSIVDDTTDEVIKEIPSKKLLDMYAEMTDYLGLLVDRKV